MSIDHCDEVGWPQAALPVRKLRARARKSWNWYQRKNRPLWFRALKTRGSLRRAV